MNKSENPAFSPRREFLLQAGGLAAAAWVQAQWPSVMAAAQHAHQALRSTQPPKFVVLTAEQAQEVTAIAARILPTDELPGATEAGVVYFIDHALKTFASDAVPLYQQGLVLVNQLTSEKYPGVPRFSAASSEQQDEILAALQKDQPKEKRPTRRNSYIQSSDFIQVIWVHTIWGFLVDPDGGGNRDFAGWKVIDRDPAHSFTPPFGFYDQGYPGWQPAAQETEKK